RLRAGLPVLGAIRAGAVPGSGGRGARDPGPGRGDRPSPDRGRRAPHARHLPRPAGDVALAVGPFERARELCHRHDIPLWRPVFASFLGYSLALSARFSEAESLLREAINQASMMRMVVFHSQMIMWLGEARLLTGAVEEAAELADEALRNTRERGEAVLEAWALHLAAEVTTHREPVDAARA